MLEMAERKEAAERLESRACELGPGDAEAEATEASEASSPGWRTGCTGCACAIGIGGCAIGGATGCGTGTG